MERGNGKKHPKKISDSVQSENEESSNSIFKFNPPSGGIALEHIDTSVINDYK